MFDTHRFIIISSCLYERKSLCNSLKRAVGKFTGSLVTERMSPGEHTKVFLSFSFNVSVFGVSGYHILQDSVTLRTLLNEFGGGSIEKPPALTSVCSQAMGVI